MYSFQTSFCLFFGDLRTGGLIIGTLHLIIIGMVIALFCGFIWCPRTIALDLNETSRPYLVLALCATFCGIIALSVIAAAIPIFGFESIDDICQYSSNMESSDKRAHIDNQAVFMFWIYALIAFVIQWHLVAAMYSLYKSMNNVQRPNPVNSV